MKIVILKAAISDASFNSEKGCSLLVLIPVKFCKIYNYSNFFIFD